MYYVKSIIKSEVVIFLSLRKNKETKCISVQISKDFKSAVVSLSKMHRSKTLWRDRTSWEPWEFSTKKNGFFIKFLTVVI